MKETQEAAIVRTTQTPAESIPQPTTRLVEKSLRKDTL